MLNTRLKLIGTLFRKDFLDGCRNYQILLMLVTPIVLSLVFSQLFKDPKGKGVLPKIGVIASPQQDFLQKWLAEDSDVKLTFYQSRSELERGIFEKEIALGMILPDFFHNPSKKQQKPQMLVIMPDTNQDFITDRLKCYLEFEIRRFFEIAPPELPVELVLEKVSGDKGKGSNLGKELFPMLVVMAMGMVGFLGLPLSFVEEKEKKTMNALMLSPLSSGELIIGKSVFSLFLILITILLMVILNGYKVENPAHFWILAFFGSLFCIFTGLLIGLVSETQGSVNAIGTTLFMFFQLIPNLSRTSDIMKKISPLSPSTYISNGIKKALFLDLSKVDINVDLAVVISITLIIYLVLFFSMKIPSQK